MTEIPSGTDAPRNGRGRMSRRTRTLLNVVAGVVLFGGIAVAIGACWLVRESESMAITRATFDAVSVGQTENAARRLLPYGQSKLAAKLVKKAFPKQAAPGRCWHYLSRDEHAAQAGHILVYRLCFVDRAVSTKSRLDIGDRRPGPDRLADRSPH